MINWSRTLMNSLRLYQIKIDTSTSWSSEGVQVSITTGYTLKWTDRDQLTVSFALEFILVMIISSLSATNHSHHASISTADQLSMTIKRSLASTTQVHLLRRQLTWITSSMLLVQLLRSIKRTYRVSVTTHRSTLLMTLRSMMTSSSSTWRHQWVLVRPISSLISCKSRRRSTYMSLLGYHYQWTSSRDLIREVIRSNAT